MLFAAIPDFAWSLAIVDVLFFVLFAVRPPKIIMRIVSRGPGLHVLHTTVVAFIGAPATLLLGLGACAMDDMRWSVGLPAFILAPILFAVGVAGVRSLLG